jgi:hypothetical protein
MEWPFWMPTWYVTVLIQSWKVWLVLAPNRALGSLSILHLFCYHDRPFGIGWEHLVILTLQPLALS